MKEAMFWESREDKKVCCTLCPRACVISSGKKGFCKGRVNHDGVLISESYGMVTAANPDPIEKKPLYHFKPGSNAFSIGTYGCNLACDFCQNYEISQSGSPPSVKLSPDEIVAKSHLYGCKGIAYTYSEPLTWIEFVMDTSRANDGYNVLVSNGYINEEPLDELLPFIDAANIDVKGGKEFYSSLCHAPYKNTMETVRAMHDSGVHVEVTHLLVPGHNDIAPLCDEIVLISPDIPLHFSRFFPYFKMSNTPPTPIESLDRAALLAKEKGIRHVYIGNVWERSSDTRCPSCRELLIKRSGYVVSAPNFSGKCPNCGCKIYGVW